MFREPIFYLQQLSLHCDISQTMADGEHFCPPYSLLFSTRHTSHSHTYVQDAEILSYASASWLSVQVQNCLSRNRSYLTLVFRGHSLELCIWGSGSCQLQWWLLFLHVLFPWSQCLGLLHWSLALSYATNRVLFCFLHEMSLIVSAFILKNNCTHPNVTPCRGISKNTAKRMGTKAELTSHYEKLGIFWRS